ncbi:MAG TPA: DUF4202 domain-containing protein [Casimicrobiaceae bacterium]|nr:DUF4202 domain-containing protein [Casimicrobiaceae bacterium]
MNTSARYAAAIGRFDAANAEDPGRDLLDGRERPKALVYAERLTAMLARFAPDASEALRLAARCQHLQRWKIPRADYPTTRAGYHQWRNRLRDFHAERAGAILSDVGYDDATIARVASLVRKEALKADGEAQALEDVVALVFVESYLAEFVAQHGDYDEAKLADILTKTARKMSARGREAALTRIRLPSPLADVVRRAIGGVPPGAR